MGVFSVQIGNIQPLGAGCLSIFDKRGNRSMSNRDEPQMLTAFDLRQCRMTKTIHLNGGGVFFGWISKCVEHPRLQRMDKCIRKTKATEITYLVDGERVASLDEAAERLNLPPELTIDLRAALLAIGDEPQDHRKSIGYTALRKLSDRGLVEWTERGKCRRTPLGASCLANKEAEA